MDDPRLDVPPIDVRKVQKQFNRWRAHKRGRLIPERLWRAAGNLSQGHGIHRISRWLRLNYTALRDRAGRKEIRPAVTGGGSRPGKFVEWMPAAVSPAAPASAEYLLEVERSGERTVRVRVRGAAISEVAALARALRRGSRQG